MKNMQQSKAIQSATAAQTRDTSAVLDTAKRQQLMEGARRAFLEHGFDGASVGDIVRAAGISKGTLYAYFPSKEKLFETLIFEDKRKQAEAACIVDEADEDVARVLTKLGTGLLEMLSQPEAVAFVRIVIGAAGKFPEIGRAFYEAGAMYGNARLAAYLRRMSAKGLLTIDEPERAARQFSDLCKSGIHVQMLFGCSSEPPSKAEIERNVESAVFVFMKAYGRQG
jgi:AcrR family transcriptional regulator